MKMKTGKKAAKNSAAESTENKDAKKIKKAKKSKPHKSVETATESDEVVKTKSEAPTEATSVEKPSKVLPAKSMFQHFKELTNEDEQTRMNAALQLLQQLNKTKEAEKRQKELSYTLKRLIRGCGASTNSSRAGFFTGLVACLKTISAADISIELIFATLEKELHVGATVTNKEDADAVVGKILTCGALLHAGRLVDANSEHLEQVTNILLQSSKHRTYHTSLGFSFLIELLESITQTQFEASVWPLLHKELTKPWPKQTLQTVHCLIAAQRKFPTIINSKYLKNHFGGVELLNSSSYEVLHKIFWEHSNTSILAHPAFELFGAYIANNENLSEFWKKMVDPALETPTKLLEIETLKIAADILNNLTTEKTQVVDILSRNFMRMIVEGLRNLKQKKDDTFKAFYDEFLEALVNCCAKKSVNDTQRVAVIRRLLLPPGAFNIEKFTSTRIVHQLINSLGEQGVQSVYELYKSVFLATVPKNSENVSENWLNFERQNAGYMLQHLVAHKAVAQSYSWRGKQLCLFFTCGIFYVNDAGTEICKKEACGAFSNEFGEQCKNMFYSSLQSKLTDLEQERQLLLKLAHFCNEQMEKKQANKSFKIKQFTEQLQQAWKTMYAQVTQHEENTVESKKSKKHKLDKDIKKHNQLELVFHILLLNMGLQLFREPEMAIGAIEDLLKCMQRTKEQSEKKQKHNKAKQENESEPEWIEVVIDLFLHLLSQNASALRNIVNALFPHLSPSLNLSAVHQILAMLDMKDGQNPLSAKGEKDEEEDDESDEDDDDGSVKERYDSNIELDEEDADDDEDDDDDDDDDENDNDDDDEDEDDDSEEVITDSDKLRNAISQALIQNGGAISHDDEMDSVDLNDVTEEEGRKLDEALANAFKALKKSGGATQSKKSKSYRVQTTTLMHFRIRVLDLIEIYLQQNPTLLISIEIMLALYDMLQYCIGDELKPLQSKVEKVLTKLTTLKSFTCDNELQEDNIADFIRLVVEKKAPASIFDLSNKMRNKCIVFLIGSTHKVVGDNKAAHKVLTLCQEYLDEFIKSRNPIVNITLLSDIFKLRWNGVWGLAVKLTQQGITLQTRTFRRIQIYEILTVLYKNYELLKQDLDLSRKELKKIEKRIGDHIKTLANSSTDSAKLSAKEFQTLLELLLNAQRASAKLQLQTTLATPAVCSLLQDVRRKIKLESTQLYQRFCGVFKLQVIRNNEVIVAENKQNGHVSHEQNDTAEVDNDAMETDTKSAKEQKRERKRKNSAQDLRKEKKLKKQQRMQAASKGLNGGIPFVAQSVESGDDD